MKLAKILVSYPHIDDEGSYSLFRVEKVTDTTNWLPGALLDHDTVHDLSLKPSIEITIAKVRG